MTQLAMARDVGSFAAPSPNGAIAPGVSSRMTPPMPPKVKRFTLGGDVEEGRQDDGDLSPSSSSVSQGSSIRSSPSGSSGSPTGSGLEDERVAPRRRPWRWLPAQRGVGSLAEAVALVAKTKRAASAESAVSAAQEGSKDHLTHQPASATDATGSTASESLRECPECGDDGDEGGGGGGGGGGDAELKPWRWSGAALVKERSGRLAAERQLAQSKRTQRRLLAELDKKTVEAEKLASALRAGAQQPPSPLEIRVPSPLPWGDALAGATEELTPLSASARAVQRAFLTGLEEKMLEELRSPGGSPLPGRVRASNPRAIRRHQAVLM